jgi:hypothetical protein
MRQRCPPDATVCPGRGDAVEGAMLVSARALGLDRPTVEAPLDVAVILAVAMAAAGTAWIPAPMVRRPARGSALRP